MKSQNDDRGGFRRFRLHDALLRGIEAAGFERPRPIQADTIPAGMAGRDVLGLAQTGTGKTAAFALPLLHRILDQRSPAPSALVLAPTRELATQIAAEIGDLSRFTQIRTVTIYGGVSQHRQVQSLRRRPDIVVGCPGRVLDLLGQGHLRLGDVRTLVLDEADHMFDMGFLPDIRKILAALPERRQNLLFSASMPREIRGLADDLLHRPHVVELEHSAPADTIDHALFPVAEQGKRALLEHMLRLDACDRAIVFTRTKHRAKRLARQLERDGHRAVALQGNMSQSQRDRAMNGFRQRAFDVLVATDIAARGIDVSDVSHVINYDVPSTPEAYTHRIGRTGRAEREGIACTFVTDGDSGWVRSTERMIGHRLPRVVDGHAEPQPRTARPASVAAATAGGPAGSSEPRRRPKRQEEATGGGRSRKRRRRRRRPVSRAATRARQSA